MANDKTPVAKIQAALAETGARWQAGITAESELSEEEKRLRTGYVPGPTEPSLQQREHLARANLAMHAALAAIETAYPASYDLRNVNGANFISPIRDQGFCGSCVSFGTCATVEATMRVSKNDPNLNVDFSEAHLFYCYAQSQGRTCGGPNGGWWPSAALDAFKNSGVADEACYPYVAGDQACTGLCSDWQSRVTKISDWHAMTSPADMKTWISTRGPLIACYTVYDDFYSYKSGIYHNVVQSPNPGGHCVSIVGYDDNQQYWICKNSWGPTWGESGFFRIAYGEVGIDGTMWSADAAATLPGTWQMSKRIIGLWANDVELNAYVFADGLGWKRVSPASQTIFLNLLTILATAKTANRLVNFYEENGEIKQAYVL
jgi:C1A family cysteine protease